MTYNHYTKYTNVIYRLLAYAISNPEEIKYPQLDIYQRDEFIFKTFADAETKIHQLVEKDNELCELYCFFIYEVPIGINYYKYYAQKTWSFTADGVLNSESKASNIEDINGNLEIFKGRTTQECRFVPGNIIECFCGDKVILGVIQAQPLTPDRITEILSLSLPNEGIHPHPDFTDDSYMVISEGMEYHSHLDTTHCFPCKILKPIKNYHARK